MVRGVYSVDGGFSRRSLTAHWARRLFQEIPREQEVDMLFISNRPHPTYKDCFEEWVFLTIVNITLAGYPELLRGAHSISPKLRKAAEVFGRKHPRIRMCALYPMPDENIYPNEWRRYILRERGELTRRRTENLLRALKPVREI